MIALGCAVWIAAQIAPGASGADVGFVRAVLLDRALFVRIEAPDEVPLRDVEVDLERGDLAAALGSSSEWPTLGSSHRPERCLHGRLRWPYPLPTSPDPDSPRLPDASRLRTDATGIVVIEPHTPRTWRIPDSIEFVVPRARGPWWFGELALPVADGVGTEAQPVVVRLGVERGVLAGRVVDDRGEPIAFTWQSVDAPRVSAGCFDKSGSLHACASDFRIACGVNATALRFSSPAHASRMVLAAASLERVTVVLPRTSRIDAQVAMSGDIDAEWFALRVSQATGGVVAESELHGPSARLDLDAEGSVTVDLVLRSSGDVVDSRRASVARGASTNVGFDAPPLAWATIRLTIDGAVPNVVGVVTPSGMRVLAGFDGIVRVPCPRDGVDLVVCGLDVAERRIRATPGTTAVELTRVR